MNFLNKKYTSRHNTSQYSHSHSHSFLPSSSTVREVSTHIITNANCEIHPN